eukprot:SAG22_NODE_15045_length_358_cov_1.196911_1_plen_119_part_11
MYEGAGSPPLKCAACKTDPRAGNCGGRTYVPSCCSASPSCDGKVLPTDDRERGKDYNHSSFIDLIISGLVGLRALLHDSGAATAVFLTVSPLADPSLTQHFALDNVACARFSRWRALHY